MLESIAAFFIKYAVSAIMGLIAGAVATYAKIESDKKKSADNAKKLADAQKGGDDEAEKRASEDILNGN